MTVNAVLHIAPCFVDLNKEGGGVANVVRQLCLRQIGAGLRVVLICTNTELGAKVAEPAEFIHPSGVEVFIVSQTGSKFTQVLNAYKVIRTKIADHSTVSVAHVHTCFSFVTEISMRLLFKARIPFVFMPHGKLSKHMLSTRRLLKQAWWNIFFKFSISKASALGLVSKNEIDEFEWWPSMPAACVIPNGFERPSHNDVSANLPEKYLLYLGYLDPRKQPEFLVRAFAASKSSETHYLVFVGPDNYNHASTINAAIEECNVKDRVVMFGPAYSYLKWAILSKASCICLPSLGEGLPVVLCESLGSGTPSISSVQCNFPALADNGAGYVIDGFDTATWAQAIDLICLNLRVRQEMSNAALLMSKQYEWSSVSDKWIALYNQIKLSPVNQ